MTICVKPQFLLLRLALITVQLTVLVHLILIVDVVLVPYIYHARHYDLLTWDETRSSVKSATAALLRLIFRRPALV